MIRQELLNYEQYFWFTRTIMKNDREIDVVFGSSARTWTRASKYLKKLC